MVLGIIDCYTQPVTNWCISNVHKHHLYQNLLLFPLHLSWLFYGLSAKTRFQWKAQSPWKQTKPDSEQHDSSSGALVAAGQGSVFAFDSDMRCTPGVTFDLMNSLSPKPFLIKLLVF